MLFFGLLLVFLKQQETKKYLYMSNIVTTQWISGMQFKSDNPSGKTFVMDTDVEGSDERFGLSPKAMMLSSLAGCTGLDVVSVLSKMKVEVEDFKMVVEGELTDEHPRYYHKVTVDYHFRGKDLKKSKLQKAVDLSVDKYCGVMEMFRQFAEVKTAIHIQES